MILPQLVVGNGCLLGRIIGGFEDVLHQPFVAGSCRKHTTHQVVAAVRMSESMEGIVGVNAELLGRNKDCSGSSEGNVASTLADHTGSNRRGRIVTGTGADLDRAGNSQLCSNIRINSSNAVIAFKELGHLGFGNSANIQHFL